MRFTLLLIACLAGVCASTGSARGEVVPDSVVADSTRRALIPVRVRTGGVRIRSMNDRRRIVILRPELRVILPGPPPAAAAGVLMSSLPSVDGLAGMEARLMDYIDSRLSVMEQRLVSSGTTVLPSQVVVIPGASERTTTVVPVPVPVPVGSRADTAATDSSLFVTAVSDSADTTRARPPQPFVIEPTTSVVEVERAILDSDLLRTTSVLFESNKADLMPASMSVLSTLGIVLARHPEVRLEIAGHTDSQGPEEYNMKLSVDRADAVRNYLLGNYSIDAARLTARGYGETRPIADDSSPTGRAMNRRVDFVLIR